MSLRIRRGGADPGSPPVSSGYGPTAGVQPTRDSTIPYAVTIPTGTFTTVNPGDNIATKITTAGVGGTLWFTKGTYTVAATLNPLLNQTWVLESAAGYTRDTTNSAVLSGSSLITALVLASVAGVTIRGGVFQNQGTSATTTSTAAIQHTKGGVNADGGWLVEDAIIWNNAFGMGIRLCGDNCTMRRLYVHTNGRYGLNSAGISGDRVNNLLIENCRVRNNNTTQQDPEFDSGGTKFTHQDGAIVRSCWFENNYGSGIWFDGDNVNCTYQDNVIEDNRNWGIFYEISGGGTTIQRNYLSGNGVLAGDGNIFASPQILVSTCDGQSLGGTFNSIEITKNLITGSGQSIYLIDTAGHLLGYPATRSVHVLDNDVTWTTTNTNRTGAGGNTSSDQIYTRDNTFEDNHYHTPDTSPAYFHWSGGTPGAGVNKTWAQWNAFGNDTPGGSIS
jgi:parallel beta-helix repeat protein